MDSPTDTTTNGTTGGKADQVARTITDLIAGGSLSPGERLPGERQLAERMGVSRVSVRAALQRLKAQGMVTSVQGGGTRVASASANLDAGLAVLLRGKLDNLHDLAEIRMALETWAAGRARSARPTPRSPKSRAILTPWQPPGRGGVRTAMWRGKTPYFTWPSARRLKARSIPTS